MALVVCAAVALTACSSGANAAKAPKRTTTTGSPTSTSSTTSNTPAGVPTTTTTTAAPAVSLQIAPTGVIVTLFNHFSDLADQVTDAELETPTSFRATLENVLTVTASAVTQSSASGEVASASATPDGQNVDISITLRQAEPSFSTAVGGGDEVQFTFSS